MKILIAIPAYNEAKILTENLIKIYQFCQANIIGHDWKIVLADNNSKDQTAEVVKNLTEKYSQIEYVFEGRQGKGIAIRTAWQKNQAEFDIFIFMDADLATDLSALPKLIEGFSHGNDLVIGSRNLKDSEVEKSFLRHLFSFCYRLVLKIVLQTKIKDLPCGFKAINKKVLENIIPQVKNTTWFFDSEMIYLAEKKGYKIKEVPVKWAEPRDGDDKSRVSLLKVSWQYLREILRLKFGK